MSEYYIGQYRDHYAIFDSMGRVQTQYDTHAEAKADLDSYNKTGKPLPESIVMNEGLIMWGLFGVVIGISALYNRIDEAKRKKQNKKNKSNSSDNAIGITEKEINELARQAKALKADIITKQKSSSLYKTLYQYMTKWNTDDYVNVVKALKSGESVDLGLDFRTDVYYTFVEFFDLSNNDFTKQLNDPDDDDEAEKLEIKYESKSFEEMKKHLTSLGFDLNKKLDGRYYSSKKYPDLIIRYIDGDDGTGIIIEPKCILGADTFKLITEEESKKLNEDHSEISNDPEMEKLLALAGITTADLDDLENDNDLDLDEDDPIDANTLREIDAAMDESVKSNIDTIKLADKAMEDNINQIEKFIPTAKEFLSQCKQKLVFIDKFNAEEFRTFTVGKKGSPEYNYSQKAKVFAEKCHAYDYNRGSDAELSKMSLNWVKYRLGTSIGKLGYNNKKVSVQQVELYKKCIDGGEYDKRLKYCGEELQKIHDNALSFIKSLEEKYSKEQLQKCINYQMALLLGSEYNYFFGQYCFTIGDKKSAETFSGRTRISFFGKKIKDSMKSQNESIGDFIRDTKNYFKNASEFLKHRKENSKSKGKDSEDNIKNTPAYKDASKKLDAFGDSIAEKVVAHLKEYATKNNFKSVYNNTAFSINDIKYCPINGYDVQVSDLQDGIDYNQVSSWEQKNPEKDWQKEPQFNNEWYHELLTEGEEFAKSLLQKDCPDIYDYYVNTGDGDEGLVYIDISLSNAYIKSIKEDSKKTQNESTETNLDILLSESAEFLFDE